MKLCYSTLACPEWTLEQCVEEAKKDGYEGLEIRLLDKELMTGQLDKEKRRKVKSLCTDNGMPVVCVDTSVGLAQPDPLKLEEQVKECLAFLEMAVEWKAPFVRVFAGPPKGTALDDAVRGCIEGFKVLEKRASQLGVAVLLETHDAFAHGTVAKKVLEGVPGKGAGILWDVMNSSCIIGEPVKETFEDIKSRLRHVHIKDWKRNQAGSLEGKYQLLGQGELPTVELIQLLRGADYQGWLSVEWEKKWCPDIEEPEIALPQYAKKLREYLAGC